MQSGNKLLLTLLLGSIIVLAYLYYKDISKFPITNYVCGPGYTDCFPVAKFDDRASCESHNEWAGWLCDSTDKSNIKCKESDHSFAIGYCK